MRGGYDLHGRYYPNVEDAINAEMAQCAEIDLRHANRRIADLERQTPEQDLGQLFEYITQLEERILHLEKITKHLNPS